jgi:hypothetical protein
MYIQYIYIGGSNHFEGISCALREVQQAAGGEAGRAAAQRYSGLCAFGRDVPQVCEKARTKVHILRKKLVQKHKY